MRRVYLEALDLVLLVMNILSDLGLDDTDRRAPSKAKRQDVMDVEAPPETVGRSLGTY